MADSLFSAGGAGSAAGDTADVTAEGRTATALDAVLAEGCVRGARHAARVRPARLPETPPRPRP
jgi:hypothetical protein